MTQADRPTRNVNDNHNNQWETEQQFRVLVQNITDYAIMMLDTTGYVTMWNEGAARLKRYSASEIIGKHVSVFYPPEELRIGRPEQEMARALGEGRSEVEGFRVRKDGSQFWVNEIMTPIRSPSGEATGFAKISRDLTERKSMDDALRESEERYRLLVDNARDYAIFMTDANGQIRSWNTGAERIFGYSGDEVIGRESAILFTVEDRAAGVPAKEMAQAVSEGRAIDDRWHVRKGGERFWVSGITTPHRDSNGMLRSFVKIARDLTEQRNMEDLRNRVLEQERIARLEAERSVAVKDEFLAIVSHELRTPLTTILLWSQLLTSGSVKPAELSMVYQSIRRSAENQRQLIEDLLDVSRMTSGKLRLNRRDVDLNAVVDAAIDVVRPMAEAKGVILEIDLPEHAFVLKADPDRIQQVVWNLLNNAIKFTQSGGQVLLRFTKLDGTARIEVADNGHGIDPKFLPHIWEAFRQGEGGYTRTYGGLGLGLAIVRQLVELHGGTVHAESPGPNKGATFTVELPLPSPNSNAGVRLISHGAQSTSRSFEPAPMLNGVRMLLVEDDQPTRTALQWVLEQCGAQVTPTGSAAQAVAAFRQAIPQQGYDLLISDIGMPVQDGYELIREIREMEQRQTGSRTTPAIALTAYARAEDRQRVLAAGFQAYISKPVEPSRLVDSVADILGRNRIPSEKNVPTS